MYLVNSLSALNWTGRGYKCWNPGVIYVLNTFSTRCIKCELVLVSLLWEQQRQRRVTHTKAAVFGVWLPCWFHWDIWFILGPSIIITCRAVITAKGHFRSVSINTRNAFKLEAVWEALDSTDFVFSSCGCDHVCRCFGKCSRDSRPGRSVLLFFLENRKTTTKIKNHLLTNVVSPHHSWDSHQGRTFFHLNV